MRGTSEVYILERGRKHKTTTLTTLLLYKTSEMLNDLWIMELHCWGGRWRPLVWRSGGGITFLTATLIVIDAPARS